MIVWKLTEQQADQVLAALQYRPFIEVNGLIGVLMQQAQQQQQEATQPQTGQAILGGARVAAQAQEQQVQDQPVQKHEWPVEPAPQVANGIDRV
jgi:hypothetical protein